MRKKEYPENSHTIKMAALNRVMASNQLLLEQIEDYCEKTIESCSEELEAIRQSPILTSIGDNQKKLEVLKRARELKKMSTLSTEIMDGCRYVEDQSFEEEDNSANDNEDIQNTPIQQISPNGNVELDQDQKEFDNEEIEESRENEEN
jgi:hypothetical protein